VVLWVATSAVDTDFTAKLIDVYAPSASYPQGYALNLTDSIAPGMGASGGSLSRRASPWG
jgi:predicted acyl esterase